MAIAGRTCLREKKFSFSHQIEKFPWHLRRGGYKGPWYNCDITDCAWNLIIGSYSGSIEISLSRKDYKKDYQSINVHVSIADSFNLCPIYASKEIDFGPHFNDKIVLCVTREEIFKGYCGLNKVRFVPNDTLTLKCEITAYETVEEEYASADKLEDTTKYVKNEVLDMLWLLSLFAVAVGSVLYISLRFVVPFIGRFISLSGTGYVITAGCVSLISFLMCILLLCQMGNVWQAVKPGGDRTYRSPNENTQKQRQPVDSIGLYQSSIILTLIRIRYLIYSVDRM